jgi:hypothetical protein
MRAETLSFLLSDGRFRIEAGEDLLDHHSVFDARCEAHRPAAHSAGLDVDAEHTLQALCPPHRRSARGRVKSAGGLERVLTFMGNTATSGSDEVEASKTNGLWTIEVNDDEHYRVSESVISGG